MLISMLCVVAGLAVLGYQIWCRWYGQKTAQLEVLNFRNSLDGVQDSAADGSSQSSEEQNTATDIPYPELFAAMQEYNRNLYETGQSGLVDAWSYEQPVFDLSQYGLDSDVIGTLSIPAMDQELPIYLGATEDNMSKGVVVLGQTSMPIGGDNTNCVIAGHRGYNGIPFFREIEKLKMGDTVSLTTYWGTLDYQVTGTKVIVPDDVEAVLLQPGKTMLTLVTCHPYPENTYRYIVYCESINSQQENPGSVQDAEQQEVSVERLEQMDRQSQLLIALQQWLPLIAIPLLVVLVALLYSIYKKMRQD